MLQCAVPAVLRHAGCAVCADAGVGGAPQSTHLGLHAAQGALKLPLPSLVMVSGKQNEGKYK